MAANMSFVGSLPGSGPRRASGRPSPRSTLLLRRTKSAAAIENQSASDVASTAADRSSFLEESFDSPRSDREPATTSMLASSRAGSPTCSATSDGEGPSQLEVSSEKAPSSRADIEWLLSTLSRTQREHFQRPAFYEDCRRKFAALDRDNSGFLEADELGPTVLEMFPALQQGILVEGSNRSLPPFSSVAGLIEAFDTDMDGKISIDEFPDFVRFCQAWRLHLYFSAPREEFRDERRRAAASAAAASDDAASAARRRPFFGCPLQSAEAEVARRLFPKTPGAGLGSGASSASGAGRPASGMRRSASTASGMLPQLLPAVSRHSSSSRRSSPRKGGGSSASGILSDRRPPAAPAALVEQRPANSGRRSRLPSAASSRCPSINSQRPSSACSSQQGRRPRSASGATASTAASSSSSTAASRCASIDVRDGFAEAPSQKRAPKLLDPADLARRLPGVSRSTSGAPSGASRKRRGKSSKLVSAADPEQVLAEQLKALATVVESVGCTRPLAELSNTLLRHVLARDGTPAFPEALVEAVAEDVLAARSKLMQPGKLALEPAGAVATSLVVRLLRVLGEKSPLELGDIVGQILWRHRRALRHTCFAKVAEDVSWIAEKESTFDVLDMVDGVYRGLTMNEPGGLMMKPQWNRAVKFILRNPVLGPRINRSDIDRLFYCETHSKGNAVANPTISPSEFKVLLLQLADASKIHPHMVFVCVGVHAEELIEEASAAAERGDVARSS